MSTSESPRSTAEPSDIPIVTEYRAVSKLAVLTFVLGIASCLVLTGSVLFTLPAATVLIGLLTLRSIEESEGALIGRPLVIWGLVLALFFTATAIGRTYMRRELAIRDARQLASTFLQLLQENEPQKAHQLQYLENQRQPPGVSLWMHYRTTRQDYEGLVKFVDSPLARTLQALGDKATIRYYDTEEIVENQQAMAFSLLYTVTYQEAGKPQTFFVRVAVRREVEPHTGILDWSIDNYQAGVRPYEATR